MGYAELDRYKQEKLARERQAQTALTQCYTTLWQFHERGRIQTAGDLPFIPRGRHFVLDLSGDIDVQYSPRIPMTSNDVMRYGLTEYFRTYNRHHPNGFSNKIALELTPSLLDRNYSSEAPQNMILNIQASYLFQHRWQTYIPTRLLIPFLKPEVEAECLVNYKDDHVYRKVLPYGTDVFELMYVLALNESVGAIAKRIAMSANS